MHLTGQDNQCRQERFSPTKAKMEFCSFAGALIQSLAIAPSSVQFQFYRAPTVFGVRHTSTHHHFSAEGFRSGFRMKGGEDTSRRC